MKSYLLFILFGLVALGAVAGTAFIGAPEASLAPTGLGERALPKFDQDGVRQIKLARGDQSVLLTRGSTGYWEVPAEGNYPANDVVSTALQVAASLQVDDRLPASAADLASYGLDDAHGLRVSLSGASAGATADLIVGLPGPGNRGGYFRHAGVVEILESFDTRLSQLPLEPRQWLRMQMGLIDAHDLTIHLAKADIQPISIVQFKDHWILQGLQEDSNHQPIETANPTALERVVSLAAGLQCDGIFPLGTKPDDMGFSPNGPTLVCRNPDSSVVAMVRFGSPRKLPGAHLIDGSDVGEPVVPMQVAFQVAKDANLGDYPAYFNRQASQRLFWLRQSNFQALFPAHDQLTVPVKPKATAPGLLNPLNPLH
ncbi:MAG: DUF4340 domain-containing protein [Planctomycetota bacterium]